MQGSLTRVPNPAVSVPPSPHLQGIWANRGLRRYQAPHFLLTLEMAPSLGRLPCPSYLWTPSRFQTPSPAFHRKRQRLMCLMEVDKESPLGLAGAGLLSQQAHFPYGDTMCHLVLVHLAEVPGVNMRVAFSAVFMLCCCCLLCLCW